MDDSSAQPEPEQLPPDSQTEPPPSEASVSRPVAAPELEQVLPKAVRYIKAKRGGDLAAIFLVGSAARDALLPHSDVNLVVLVHGAENRHELVRILQRIVEIRYLGLPTAEEQMKSSLRLPATMRKAQILFEYEGEGAYFLEQAHARFRQGAPSLTLHEKIRLRNDALHWLGKAEDQAQQPALARYLFSIYLDECINAFHHLRGYWLTAATDSLRFISQRDPAFGDLLQQALGAADLSVQFEIGHRLADHLFRDIPTPARID